MVEKTEVVRIKCGQIFILSKDNFSLICEFCVQDFYTFEDFRVHLHEHFPQVPMNIKQEDSISYGSDYMSIPPEIEDDVKVNLTCLQNTTESQSIPVECVLLTENHGLSNINDNQVYQQAIKIEPGEENQVQSTSGIENKITTKKKVKKVVQSTIDPTKSKKKGYECSFCGKMCRDKRQCYDHENTHTGKRPYECHICTKSFASRSALYGHIRFHTDDRRQECPSCEKRFLNKTLLDNHTRENHLPDSDPRRYFPCQLCDRKLKSYAQMKRHGLTHRENTVMLICDYCQKTCKIKTDLIRHMLIHSGKKPYKCNYCQKTFAQSSNKNRHERKCENNSSK